MKNFQEPMLREMQIRNYSSSTIRTYLSMLKALSEFYNKEPDQISIAEFKGFLHTRIIEANASTSFVNQTISAFKIYWQDVLKREWDDITIKRPRRKKQLPVVLSKNEVMAILNSIDNLKHKALITTIYSGGLRISEVLSLRPNDIDSDRMQIRIWSAKGHKDRVTLLSKTNLILLRRYYTVYRPHYWLFEGFDRSQYSTSSIRRILKKAVSKSGIKKEGIKVHTLRHSFATHLLEQGISIQIIQKLMGHSTAQTTCKYLHVQQYLIDNVVSPLDYFNE